MARPPAETHRGKMEIAFAVLRVFFKILDDLRGSVNAFPVDSRIVSHDHKAVDVLRLSQDSRQQLGLLGIVRVLAHGRANVRRESFLLRQLVIGLERIPEPAPASIPLYIPEMAAW